MSGMKLPIDRNVSVYRGEGESEREGGRSRRRRSSARQQIGTDYYSLRCPICRAFKEFISPAYKDGPKPWEDQPFLRCDSCSDMSATSAWAVAIAHFRPLPA